MSELLSAALMLAGAGFSLAAALGALRMPDLIMRMHATAKAAPMGVGLTVLSVVCQHADGGIAARALALLAFLALTAPVSAHLIARATYHFGPLELWPGTLVDELREHQGARQPGPLEAPEEP